MTMNKDVSLAVFFILGLLLFSVGMFDAWRPLGFTTLGIGLMGLAIVGVRE